MAWSGNAVIVGAGRHGRVVAQTLIAEGNYRVAGFLDDDPSKHGSEISGLPVLGGLEWLLENADLETGVIVAIGNNEQRSRIGRQLRMRGIPLIKAIHPSAVVMDTATIDTGSLICAGSIIVAGVEIKQDVVVNTGATIEHDSILRAGSMLASGVQTAGCVEVGQNAFVGTGSIIGPGVIIGDRAIVGMGSLVLDDLPPDVLAFGAPARIVRSLAEPVDWKEVLGGH